MITPIEHYIRTHTKETNELHSQCAWCTLVYDGEFAGMLLFRAHDGTLLPCKPETYTHGCCPECEKRMVDHRKRKKKRERTAPAEKDGVLYF